MKFKCPKCNAILESEAVTSGTRVQCPECTAVFEASPFIRKAKKLRAVAENEKAPQPAGNISDAMQDKLTSAIGIEKLQGFSLSALFSETFSHHSRDEVEESFTVGTKASTPDIMDVDSSWPRPWLFMRMLLASLALYFLFWIGWREFANTNLIPGWIMIGSFAVPISTLVLFFELNVRRNVSLYMVSRLAFLGGILSLLVALVFFELFGTGLWGAMSAGPIEESGKLLAMLAVARAAKYRYKLNGLLIGAAVGVGFSAFESAGYALRCLIDGTMGSSLSVLDKAESMEQLLAFGIRQGSVTMENNLVVRGLLSPFGHVVWSAIVGCAMWRTIRGLEFRWSMLVDVDFIRLMIVPVVLHMIWNSPIELPFYGKYWLVGAVGWFVCLSLVQEGLREIRAEQKERLEKTETEPERVPQPPAGRLIRRPTVHETRDDASVPCQAGVERVAQQAQKEEGKVE